jgi:NADH:ubiquinone oxidoreductase subunit E
MPKKVTVRICQNYSCVENGSERVMAEFTKQTGLEAGKQNKKYDVDYACCLGCCDFGPNILVNDSLVLGIKPETVMQQIDKAASEPAKTFEEQQAELDRLIDEEL